MSYLIRKGNKNQHKTNAHIVNKTLNDDDYSNVENENLTQRQTQQNLNYNNQNFPESWYQTKSIIEYICNKITDDDLDDNNFKIDTLRIEATSEVADNLGINSSTVQANMKRLLTGRHTHTIPITTINYIIYNMLNRYGVDDIISIINGKPDKIRDFIEEMKEMVK